MSFAPSKTVPTWHRALFVGILLANSLTEVVEISAQEARKVDVEKTGLPTIESPEMKTSATLDEGVKRTPVAFVKKPQIKYPRNLREWGNSGEGLVDVTIDENGKPVSPRVLKSSHPAFEFAMVKGILEGEYKPATANGRPVATRVRMPFNFRLDEKRSADKPLSALPFRFSKSDASDAPSESAFDEAPEIKVVAPVVYPRELLQKHVRGKATVVFTLDEKGLVQSATIASATHPEFGAAAKAMIAAWDFRPARKNRAAVAATFKIDQEFDRDARDAGLNEHTNRLLRMLESGENEIAEVGALDSPPRILYQTQPALAGYIPAMELSKENTVVEFFIDPDGAVQLPRIVSANHADLGWAAASAIKRWIFEVPMKNGKPVFARHQVKLDMR
jgi:TonB family protein